MELFAATVRDAVLTALCNSVFSHENCSMCITFLSFKSGEEYSALT